mmetsp:Transcript_14440/g.36125  ORF Transcript_14440/g.36125 Transcript_14440/m.36125 type:complete len:201 (-) Transcript_14440:206-808(-)
MRSRPAAVPGFGSLGKKRTRWLHVVVVSLQQGVRLFLRAARKALGLIVGGLAGDLPPVFWYKPLLLPGLVELLVILPKCFFHVPQLQAVLVSRVRLEVQSSITPVDPQNAQNAELLIPLGRDVLERPGRLEHPLLVLAHLPLFVDADVADLGVDKHSNEQADHKDVPRKRRKRGYRRAHTGNHLGDERRRGTTLCDADAK